MPGIRNLLPELHGAIKADNNGHAGDLVDGETHVHGDGCLVGSQLDGLLVAEVDLLVAKLVLQVLDLGGAGLEQKETLTILLVTFSALGVFWHSTSMSVLKAYFPVLAYGI